MTQTISGSSNLTIDPESPLLTTINETGNTSTGAYTFGKTTIGTFTFTVNTSAGNDTAGAATTVTSDPASTIYVYETGNRKDGTYAGYQEIDIPSFSGDYATSHQDSYAIGTVSGWSWTYVEMSGDLRLGLYWRDETVQQSLTITISDGLDARGAFVATTTIDTETFRTIVGDFVTGAYALDVETTIDIYAEKTGGDGDTIYYQEVDGFTTVTVYEDVNPVTGEYSVQRGSSSVVTIDEVGDYLGTPFAITTITVSTSYREEWGNRISGDYLKYEDASDSYWMEMTATGDRNFTLTISGENTWTDEEEGNTVSGLYVRTKNGTDDYEIDVSGTRGGDSYTQTVSGTEAYTLVDSGNLRTGHYTRTIEGDGSYERESSGPGATMPSDSDTYDYYWEQVGDPHSGMFDLAMSGTSRYELLEEFYDISNTQPGRQPGHMNVYPFGQTFVDPGHASP